MRRPVWVFSPIIFVPFTTNGRITRKRLRLRYGPIPDSGPCPGLSVDAVPRSMSLCHTRIRTYTLLHGAKWFSHVLIPSQELYEERHLVQRHLVEFTCLIHCIPVQHQQEMQTRYLSICFNLTRFKFSALLSYKTIGLYLLFYKISQPNSAYFTLTMTGKQMPNFIKVWSFFPIIIIESLIDTLWFLKKNLIEDYQVEDVPVSIIRWNILYTVCLGEAQSIVSQGYQKVATFLNGTSRVFSFSFSFALLFACVFHSHFECEFGALLFGI